MQRVFISFIMAAFFTISTYEGASARSICYGTIVHADGSMTTLYRSKRGNSIYVAHFDKKGNFSGSCERVSLADYQARKAYMTAKAKWRAGYMPHIFPCSTANF
jgi:hypothetical protein